MTHLNEIIVTTFVSPQLFWIIKRKYLLLRNRIERFLARAPKLRIIDDIDDAEVIVVVNVGNIWARATVDHTLIHRNDDIETKEHVCWLLDYGVMTVVDQLFNLHHSLKELAPLAERSSLCNVVNITSDLKQDANMDFEIVETRTPNFVESVRIYTKNHLEKMDKLYFQSSLRKNSVQYGDILCSLDNQPLQSLTNYLIKEKIVAKDAKMFEEIEKTRPNHHKEFFKHRQRWLKDLTLFTKQYTKEIIWNCEDNKNHGAEYFDRISRSNRLYDEF